MKIHTEDPRLTAYLLGELAPEEAAAVEAAVAGNPELRNALAELENVRDILSDSLNPVSLRLQDTQKAAILEAARAMDRTHGNPSTRFGFKKAWMGYAAAAAVVLLGLMVFSRIPKSNSPVVTYPSQTTPAPQNTTPHAPAAAPTPPSLPEIADTVAQPQDTASVSDRPSIELPMLATAPDIDKIVQAIRIERQLPARDGVRLEKVLNRFSYRLNGVTAVARMAKTSWHPDTRDAGLTTHAATLSTETIACPWKPSATLVLVSIRGNATTDSEAKVVFRPNPAAVYHYRLLGYTESGATESARTPTLLPAKSSTTLAIEVEPAANKTDLGVIEWTINGEPAPNVALTRNPDAEPSNDARFATLACAYAQWLAGEQQGAIDKDLLSALAREISSADLPEDRADFIKLVGESLNL